MSTKIYNFRYNFECWPKFWILTKNFELLLKNSNFYRTFRTFIKQFWTFTKHFKLLLKISNFYQTFRSFTKKYKLLSNISKFYQKIRTFTKHIELLPKISNFYQNKIVIFSGPSGSNRRSIGLRAIATITWTSFFLPFVLHVLIPWYLLLSVCGMLL